MKKTLVALAALAAASGAFAQTATANAGGASSVTVFGVADVSVSSYTSEGAGSVMLLSGSGNNASSRLGFRGVEDLGGGMAAAFWLEAGVNIDSGTGSASSTNNTAAGDKVQIQPLSTTSSSILGSGTTLNGRQGLTFNRASTVSLIGKDMGEIRLGRDYMATFWNMTLFDPFGTVGVGQATNLIVGALNPYGAANTAAGGVYPSTRTSNAISWLSKDMSGFRAQVQIALSEVPENCVQGNTVVTTNGCAAAGGDGKVTALRLAYASGPLSLAFANSLTSYGQAVANNPNGIANTTVQTAFTGNYGQTNLAGSYNFGSFRLMAQYNVQSRDATSNINNSMKQTGYNLGVVVPMGATSLKASYGVATRSDGTEAAAANLDGATANQLALGFQHDLSRRTALYGTWSALNIKAGANSAVSSIGVGGITGTNIAANGSGTATGIDLGLRHSF